ncbi:VWA domain-containing protein [Stieleria sp. TO1_6]|uniref:vWA domain-containing protein n=1 Tax=Stieleria tagensis TaxID=2956795 RepID=UPI00209B3E35|nr:VWA domain-containing protein [Stieleria tagensis]MCO8122176.1 VWA domain-containing protein [Stieleria tagensis]
MFADPWVLLLLLLVPVIVWRMWATRSTTAVEFSTTEFAADIPRSIRQRLHWLPAALTVLAVILIIFALARPRNGREQTVIDSEGIAIEMVVDRSGSMQAMDFQIDGEHVDRLTAIKNVAGTFVAGDQPDVDSDSLRLSGRISDLVGLVSFAGYADAITPPTLDHAFVVSQLNKLQIVDDRSEDGTAIGDAISLAVEKLTSLDDRKQEKVKSKVVILLTDGENNAGEFDPVQAAELAEKMNVRIYTIGVGTRGQAPVPVQNPLTGRQSMRWMSVNIDEGTLRQIADATGGKYFRATDTESLEKIYAEIDQLETTKIEAQHFVDYRELAIQSIHLGAWNMPPLVLLAMLVLVLRLILSHTLLRPFA